MASKIFPVMNDLGNNISFLGLTMSGVWIRYILPLIDSNSQNILTIWILKYLLMGE